MKSKILYLYYEEKILQKDIAMQLNISRASVCRIIKQDNRYSNEKKLRKEKNKIKHNKDIQRRVEAERRKNRSIDDLILKKMHEEASRELSGGKRPISNRAFREWNSSAYKYNKNKKCYEFDRNLVRSYAIPKYVK